MKYKWSLTFIYRLTAGTWPSQQEEDDDETMARKVKSARSKKEKKPLKEPKVKKDRSKSMLPGQDGSLSGGGLTAALAGKAIHQNCYV